jgi:hypothetical protein
LTHGYRALHPDVSPDGRRVAFTTNHRGTTYLQVADLNEAGLSRVTNIVPSHPLEQAYSPRWSPDNRHLAYSAWTHGGFRDIRVVDTWDGSVEAITHDRAMDGGPSFSPDGRTLYFHSDRTGVMNVYAYDLESKALSQVTNVLQGAFQPQVSPDGRTLVYLGYTHAGWDLFAMRLDEDDFLPALAYEDNRPAPNPAPPVTEKQWRPYRPLETLAPRSYSFQSTPGNFGQAFIVGVEGTDVASQHGFGATLTVESENPQLQPVLSYVYGRLPVDLSLRAYRTISPRSGFALSKAYRPKYVQEALGIESGVSYSLPGPFDQQTVDLRYSAVRTGADLPVTETQLDPFERPTFPSLGLLSFLSLGWNYWNGQRFLWSVSPESGFGASANFSASHPWLGSQYSAFSLSGRLNGYLAMPWLQHHVLAWSLGAGTSGGSYPGRGGYYVGGYQDINLVDTVRNGLIQGGFVLRGYEPVVLAGSNFSVLNAEYRFPLRNVDRGLSTLPFFFHRVSGAFFLDYGSAFDDAETSKFKTGVGAELWFDATLAYALGFTFRAGYAKGLASEGIDKTYFVAAVPY